jgi:hypothetical protein
LKGGNQVSKWDELVAMGQSQLETALHQRIRSWSVVKDLLAMRRGGRWYFARNEEPVGPDSGLDDRGALEFVKGGNL